MITTMALMDIYVSAYTHFPNAQHLQEDSFTEAIALRHINLLLLHTSKILEEVMFTLPCAIGLGTGNS